MVELEDVTAPQDIKELQDMIANHYRYTGSAVARRVLDDWKTILDKFVKVMPVDYKKALEQMQKEKSNS
jgi:glutamate synthase domain-containing protein 3